MFVHFLNKLQQGSGFFGKPAVVSSVNDELRNNQHLSKLLKLKNRKRAYIPHHWLLKDIGQINAFQNKIFSQLTVLDNTMTPQSEILLCF